VTVDELSPRPDEEGRNRYGSTAPTEHESGVAGRRRGVPQVIFEAEFSPGMPLAACEEVALLIEGAGFDRLGISDVVLWPDTFMIQALCARVTTRVEIGAMVANPYTRHPAVTAAAVATLDNLCDGRAFVGLGVGAGLEAVGVETSRPVHTLRDAILAIRALLDGGCIPAAPSSPGSAPSAAPSAPGSAPSAGHPGSGGSGTPLRLPPLGKVPISVGTRSRQVAEMAGEVADRALVGARYLSPSLAQTYRSWVATGAERAGRDPSSIEIAPRLTLCCSSDRQAAYDTMRRDAAEFLVTLQPDDLMIERDRFEAIKVALERARGWYFDPEAYHPPELDALVDDDLVEAFSLCGNGQSLVAQFRRIIDMGFTTISLKLAPVRKPGWTMLDGLRETIVTAGEILPEVRALSPLS